MSNELTVKQAAALVPYSELERMANAFVKSGLFGVKTADQAIALMLVAQAEGQHPAIIARDYDIIQGRPAKKSEAMLRSFLQGGGKVEWHTLTDELAEATFSHPQGGAVRISWDMARASKAGLSSKDNYKKFPRQMLRNRCISEGVRTVYPIATSGMYVPEEVEEFEKPDFAPSDFTPGPFDRALDAAVRAKPWEKTSPLQKDSGQPNILDGTGTPFGLPLISEAAFEKLPFEEPADHPLSTFAIPSGPHKGIKLGDKTDAFWGEYKLQLEKLIPTLPADRQLAAEDTVKAIALYLERA